MLMVLSGYIYGYALTLRVEMAVTKMTMVISAKDNTNPPMAVG